MNGSFCGLTRRNFQDIHAKDVLGFDVDYAHAFTSAFAEPFVNINGINSSVGTTTVDSTVHNFVGFLDRLGLAVLQIPTRTLAPIPLPAPLCVSTSKNGHLNADALLAQAFTEPQASDPSVSEEVIG